MLVRLLYTSRCVEKKICDTANAIMGQAHASNPQQGITGILCYSGDIFLQVLEGGRDAINTLYGKILNDRRHAAVTLLQYEEIAERRFGSWTMGQVNLAKLNPSLLLKYSDLAVLNPYAVSGAASMALIEELIATASISGRV
jgi:Sensors of blue-light using FAD